MDETVISNNAEQPTVIRQDTNETATAVISGASMPESPNNADMLQQARAASRRQNDADKEKAPSDQAADVVNEASLRTAMRRRRIFNAPITAIEEMRSDDQVEIAAVVLLDKNVKVLIPFSELFPRNPLLYNAALAAEETPLRRTQRKRQFAEKMIDSEAPFILTELAVDGDLIIALGSRAQAMKMIAERAFGGENPRFKVGDLIEAKIISVSIHALTVMFEGVDVTIQMARLTRRWILDLHDAYRVGDSIYARIRGIRQEDDGTYRLQLDTIAVELEDARDRYHIISDGARTRATITAVFRTAARADGRPGAPRIFAWIPNYELPVRVVRLDSNTFGREVSAGTEVIVRVDHHDDDGYLVCEAIYDYGNNSMFSQGRYR